MGTKERIARENENEKSRSGKRGNFSLEKLSKVPAQGKKRSVVLARRKANGAAFENKRDRRNRLTQGDKRVKNN